jgi:death-on-curing protein
LTPVEYLTLDDAVDLIRHLGIGPVRDLGLLDSGLARPASSAFGEDAYPTVELKAAALLHSLASNHPLVDGNKRLAWFVAAVFLDLNCRAPQVCDDEAFGLVMDVARGESDLEVIVSRMRVREHKA